MYAHILFLSPRQVAKTELWSVVSGFKRRRERETRKMGEKLRKVRENRRGGKTGRDSETETKGK